MSCSLDDSMNGGDPSVPKSVSLSRQLCSSIRNSFCVSFVILFAFLMLFSLHGKVKNTENVSVYTQDREIGVWVISWEGHKPFTNFGITQKMERGRRDYVRKTIPVSARGKILLFCNKPWLDALQFDSHWFMGERLSLSLNILVWSVNPDNAFPQGLPSNLPHSSVQETSLFVPFFSVKERVSFIFTVLFCL